MGFANCVVSPRGWILELLKWVSDGRGGADEKEGNLVSGKSLNSTTSSHEKWEAQALEKR